MSCLGIFRLTMTRWTSGTDYFCPHRFRKISSMPADAYISAFSLLLSSIAVEGTYTFWWGTSMWTTYFCQRETYAWVGGGSVSGSANIWTLTSKVLLVYCFVVLLSTTLLSIFEIRDQFYRVLVISALKSSTDGSYGGDDVLLRPDLCALGIVYVYYRCSASVFEDPRW